MNKTITVETNIPRDITVVWNFWNDAAHIKQWMHASDDWECVSAKNDVTVGGHFTYALAAKDGSVSFDLPGTYTSVETFSSLSYTLNDGRTVTVTFTPTENGIHIVETFEMEHENTEELQKAGWQAMLDNFKKYTETNS